MASHSVFSSDLPKGPSLMHMKMPIASLKQHVNITASVCLDNYCEGALVILVLIYDYKLPFSPGKTTISHSPPVAFIITYWPAYQNFKKNMEKKKSYLTRYLHLLTDKMLRKFFYCYVSLLLHKSIFFSVC